MTDGVGERNDRLRQAVDTYRAAGGELSQAFVAGRFGVSVSRLRHALKTFPSGGEVPDVTQAAVAGSREPAGKEKRERTRTALSVAALALSVITAGHSAFTGHRTTVVEDQNRILTAQVQSATDPAYVMLADHRDSLYVRNGSPRPMRDVVAVKVDEGEDGVAPLFQIGLDDLRGCVDAALSVAPDVRRGWGPNDSSSTPSWVLIWTDVGGQRWELEAFASDSAGDYPGVQYEGAYAPPPSAESATIDLDRVPTRTGLTSGSTDSVTGFGLCK